MTYLLHFRWRTPSGTHPIFARRTLPTYLEPMILRGSRLRCLHLTGVGPQTTTMTMTRQSSVPCVRHEALAAERRALQHAFLDRLTSVRALLA
jgi:hypothetical protein